ncbi:hypothetical protein CNMCM5793_007924 [Aspergillus hiratsukae]|uniref:D-arabinitol 2-dehydrogenase [ribulose-forming] n=1 Tax=Aspergillus hiratsukae TaxID=1194566 RepID=A0A8H6UXP7_9EURO|nr:hypothetical protein CNMCM5793_007924 [Aspergillus hiratsukae]KAF7166640.1 hypothetical protein CNMCM6106_002383 [Aspergillus hiratsukae]
MSRNVCITSVEGNTGYLIAELLLTDENFSKEIGTVHGLTLNPDAQRCKDLQTLGATIVPHRPGRLKNVAADIRDTKADTLCLIPPASRDKIDITAEMIEATKRANVPNVVFLSAAGCDLAERDKQPHLRKFIHLESLFMSTKGDPSTMTGHSPVVIRAGFYAENLLAYAPQAKEEGYIPIPIGREHKFPPVALGDVALLAAHVLTGKGKNGFNDKHRGQLMVLTGPALLNGDEVARAASEALGTDMKFEDISEYEARKVLRSQTDTDDSEIQFILEYYSLVREGKTNYVATTAFRDVTKDEPQQPVDFFRSYSEEFEPKKGAKRRKNHSLNFVDHESSERSASPSDTSCADKNAMDTAWRNRHSYHINASTGLIFREQHTGAASSFEIQITGGAGMLALASARALLEHGLSGIALLDLPSALQKGDVEVNALRRDFPSAKIITHQCDVTDATGMQDVAEKAKNELGELDILCCFAGIVNCVAAEDIAVEQWRRVIDVNTTGSWIAAQAVGKHMIASGRGGKIVLVASISGHRVNYPQPQIAYNVSKAAVLHMKNSLAAEWTQYGIRVNSISPGYMDTVLNEGEDLAPWRQIWADRNPMRRMGSPQELTGPVVFLCSDIGGSYVNGADIVVDGGGLVF